MDAQRIRHIYEDFSLNRLERLADIFDEKIDFISHAPAGIFPYLGRRLGKAAVLEAFAEVHKKLEITAFWPITTVVDGDNAALTVLIDVRERASSTGATFLAAHFLRFRNDRMVEYRAIIDSLDAVEQLRSGIR